MFMLEEFDILREEWNRENSLQYLQILVRKMNESWREGEKKRASKRE